MSAESTCAWSYSLSVRKLMKSYQHDSLLPCKVSNQTKCRENKSHEPKDRRRDKTAENTKVFGRKANFGGNSRIDWHECHPDEHRAGDCHDGVLGPDTRCGLDAMGSPRTPQLTLLPRLLCPTQWPKQQCKERYPTANDLQAFHQTAEGHKGR